MSHQNQHFYETRRQFKAAHLDPAVALMEAATAAVQEAERRAKQAETHLEVMTPVWQHGPGFASRLALSELWAALGAKNQTEAMQRVRTLIQREGTLREAMDEASRLRYPDTTGQ